METLPDGNQWWYAVGVSTFHGGGMPGIADIVEQQVELYAYMETSSGVTSCFPLVMTPHFIIRPSTNY